MLNDYSSLSYSADISLIFRQTGYIQHRPGKREEKKARRITGTQFPASFFRVAARERQRDRELCLSSARVDKIQRQMVQKGKGSQRTFTNFNLNGERSQ